MDLENINVEKNFLLDFVKKNKLDFNELSGLVNLYKSYLFVSELKENSVNQEKTLLDYENEIYRVNGKTMTEVQKIEFEFQRLDKKFEIFRKNMSPAEIEIITGEILNLKKIFSEYSNNFDSVTLHYIKKNISVIQAKLGLRNYFLSDAYDAFLEKYMNIYVGKTRVLKDNLK